MLIIMAIIYIFYLYQYKNWDIEIATTFDRNILVMLVSHLVIGIQNHSLDLGTYLIVVKYKS